MAAGWAPLAATALQRAVSWLSLGLLREAPAPHQLMLSQGWALLEAASVPAASADAAVPELWASCLPWFGASPGAARRGVEAAAARDGARRHIARQSAGKGAAPTRPGTTTTAAAAGSAAGGSLSGAAPVPGKRGRTWSGLSEAEAGGDSALTVSVLGMSAAARAASARALSDALFTVFAAQHDVADARAAAEAEVAEDDRLARAQALRDAEDAKRRSKGMPPLTGKARAPLRRKHNTLAAAAIEVPPKRCDAVAVTNVFAEASAIGAGQPAWACASGRPASKWAALLRQASPLTCSASRQASLERSLARALRAQRAAFAAELQKGRTPACAADAGCAAGLCALASPAAQQYGAEGTLPGVADVWACFRD